MAQVGVGGSTSIGRNVVIAGQVGIVGHVEIGDGVQIGAKAGVIHSVPSGSRIWGIPSLPIGQTKRVYAATRNLPELIKEVALLKRQLAELAAEVAAEASRPKRKP